MHIKKRRKPKVIHLIPKDQLGGVERAARSLAGYSDDRVEVVLCFMVGPLFLKSHNVISLKPAGSTNSPMTLIQTILFIMRSKPDLLVCSLWRSSLVGIFVKVMGWIFGRKAAPRIAVMIHANRFAHVFDKIVSIVAFKLFDEAWFDSPESLKAHKKHVPNSVFRVLSFFIKEERKNDFPIGENFIFWGRIAKQKGLYDAIVFFNKIANHYPQIEFYIYGPDCGELPRLKQLVANLNLENKVYFRGEKAPGEYPRELKSCKFFVNLSTHEGMAISVVEAMQLGLVPIATPVGEVGKYCVHEKNAIVYKTCDEGIRSTLELIRNEVFYRDVRRQAIATWLNVRDYKEDFVINCLKALDKK